MIVRNLTILRVYLLLAALFCILLAVQIYNQALDLNVLSTSLRWSGGVVFSAAAALILALLFFYSWSRRGRTIFLRLLEPRKSLPNWLRLMGWTYGLFAAIGLAWLFLGPYGSYFGDLIERLPVFGLAVLGGGVILFLGYPQFNLGITLAFSSILLSAGLRILFFVPEVTTYPFSLGWSETSRYYYASLFFSEQIYGVQIASPVLHPSRYILQAAPFLLPSAPLWAHRLWQVLLWISLPLFTAFLLGRRLKLSPRWTFWFYVLWAFLFLYQGPVYYHLTISLIIVLYGYRRESFFKTFFFVVLASLWAGISRVNWFPVPGVLAATLYLLDTRIGNTPIWKHLLKPAVWFVSGTALGFVSQLLYAIWSGNEIGHFGTSFTSDLLWYRLLPNPSYPEGILPSILIVSLPLLLITAQRLTQLRSHLHPIRVVGLLGILAVFFIGGLVVSVKIGGGNNLHNLDAYLFFLLLIGSALYFNKIELDDSGLVQLPQPNWALTAFAISLPVIYMLQYGRSPDQIDANQVTRGLQTIEQYVEEANQADEEVLFISERHLLTFHMLPEVPLVPEHERTFLIEMAMAQSTPYLDKFHQELKDNRYGLIISQPLNRQIKGPEAPFGEENDAWVKSIAIPLLCYYEPVDTLREVNLQFLLPREDPQECDY